MKVLILNGNINDNSFDTYIEKLSENLKANHEVEVYNLNSMNLHFCTGCWSCWWKTPGLCAIKDDAELIFKSFINTDFIIFASPLTAGFISSKLKLISERCVALLHPYIQIREGECHHRKRYGKYPEFGVVLKKEKDTDQEDIDIVKEIYDRYALNFHSKQKFLKVIDNTEIEEVVYAINNL